MNIMTEQEPEPQPPLYTCTTKCFTCGNVISQIWLQYQKDIRKLTGDEPTNMPIRTINSQKLMSGNTKTEEGKLMDKYGVVRYCCRRMIISEPANTTAIRH